MCSERLIIVGKLGAPFGVAGWQHIQSFTQPIDNLLRYSTWYVGNEQNWTTFEISQFKAHQKGLVAKLKGVDDRNRVAVKREMLAPLHENEFYWIDLEGLTVYNQKTSQIIGTVDFLYQNANVDIMVVQGPAGEKHIPFQMNETVMNVDLPAKRITVDWDCSI
jgi:16S rRNA processing protein RimM